jgi:hypothetical protein
MLSVVMLTAIMLSVVMLTAIMLRVIILTPIMLSVIMLSVVAPLKILPEANPLSYFAADSMSKIKKQFYYDNISRKLTYVLVVLLTMQVACFLIGAIISPMPNSSMQYLATNCIDPSGGKV